MCDASAPVGISTAVEEAGKTGEITIVGLENLSDILALVKEGKIHSTTCTRPYIQGSNAVLMLWQQYNGIDTPKFVDTGIDIAVSYTHLTLPTTCTRCRSRWSPYH